MLNFRNMIFGLLTVLLSGVSCSASASDTSKVTIVSPQAEGLLQTDRGGLYDHILAAIVTPSDIERDFLPFNRAVRAFVDRKYDCFFIGVGLEWLPAELKQQSDQMIFSDPVNLNRIYWYVKRGPSQEKTGASKTIVMDRSTAFVLANRFGTDLDALTYSKQLETESAMDALNALQNGTVDAVLAFRSDYLAAGRMIDLQDVQEERPYEGLEIVENMMCWKSENNADFIENINRSLRKAEVQALIASLLAPKE